MTTVDPIRLAAPTQSVPLATFRIAETDDRSGKKRHDEKSDEDVVEIDGEEVERPQESENDDEEPESEHLDFAV